MDAAVVGGSDSATKAICRVLPRSFLIGRDIGLSGRAKLTIHTAFGAKGWFARRRLVRTLQSLGISERLAIRHCDFSKLARLKSLEDVSNAFRHKELISDPTGCFTRADRIVAFARAYRHASPGAVEGLYWDAVNRTIFIALHKSALFAQQKAKVRDLATAEQLALRLLTEHCGENCHTFVPRLRLGFGIPRHKIIPIDRQSVLSSPRFLMDVRTNALSRTTAALLGLGVAGSAATAEAADLEGKSDSLCAVSELNAKAAVEGGVHDDEGYDSEGSFFGSGSASIPLGCAFGLQVDGAVGTLGNDDDAAGIGAHLFWRDPTVGLLGLIASYTHVNRDNSLLEDQTFSLVGGEGELYFEQFTIAAAAGYSFGENIEDGAYGSIDLRWYLTPDMMFTGGAEASKERGGIGKIGLEFQPGFDALPGLSFFADGAFGEEGLSTAMVGLRYYFGSPKSLMERHRLDDPTKNYAKDNAKHPTVDSAEDTSAPPPGSFT
jgi:hypothetical protein